MNFRLISLILLFSLPLLISGTARAETGEGYYRFPTIHEDVIVFTSEGDLWRVSAEGGLAVRLTTHLGQETDAAISPDGEMIAFSGQYHGATEIYTIPITGGHPRRHSFEGGARVRGWTADGQVFFSTQRYSDLPNTQLALLNPKDNSVTLVPLAQADHGAYDTSQEDLFFVRLPFQGSHTKRYKGGRVQNLWKFSKGADEAVPLTGDFPGTSKDPVYWQGRVYFASDRDGTMNIWSMDEDGGSLTQHTQHVYWDVKDPKGQDGRMTYQLGADIYVLDLNSGKTRKVDIQLTSDFDQRRVKWIDKPLEYLSAAHISPDGKKVALTARGRVYVAPIKQGRMVELSRQQGIRFRDAVFSDNDHLLLLNDSSGEQEFWSYPAHGIGAPTQVTSDAETLRSAATPSPDGKYFAYTDEEDRLWVYTHATKRSKQIARAPFFSISDLTWSPDGRWLAYAVAASNQMIQIRLYNPHTDETVVATSDRVDSHDPAWSSDGNWLYFLSDRHFDSEVGSPWGPRQPEPYFAKTTEIYALALKPGLRFPFQDDDELNATPEQSQKTEEGHTEKDTQEGEDQSSPAATIIVSKDLMTRLYKLPVPPGRYNELAVNKKRLFYIDRAGEKPSLIALDIKNGENKPVTLIEDIKGFELSRDGTSLLIEMDKKLAVVEASSKKIEKVDDFTLKLKDWKIAIDPVEEWRLMLVDGWRMHRDVFYDPNMHGADWQQSLKQHMPLLARVNSREELNDLIGQMVGDTEALHSFVRGGDLRQPEDSVASASLGAELLRDDKAGGYRITRIYHHDPDYIDKASPLLRPEVRATVGDVITAINGVSTLSVTHPAELLDNQVGQQTRLRLKPRSGQPRDVIVTPINARDARNLRYTDWELSRREAVDKLSDNKIGYVHLRAMGKGNFTEWVQGYYPVYRRNGLIVDVRHNSGGNIDSWILEKLLRKIWFYWRSRHQEPYPNMQYAFNGHMVVLMNERTASDGEAFAEGFRQLGLGKLIGTRTWGGEIWGGNNQLVDGGVQRVPSMGVFSPNGDWIIEGPGVIPDIEVDNLPHETFQGKDKQLEAAIAHLQKLMKEDPREYPTPPPYPNLYEQVQ